MIQIISNKPIPDDEIKVGTRCTELMWTDRVVWEIVYRVDPKTVIARRMRAVNKAKAPDQDWELSSNVNEQLITLRKYKDGWYQRTFYGEKMTNRFVMGVAEYWYDFSF